MDTDTAKMADDVSQQIENALNMIVNFTDKSGNLKKELKNSIHEDKYNIKPATLKPEETTKTMDQVYLP